jgi:beta-galactosidase/beta-glucuronidase
MEHNMKRPEHPKPQFMRQKWTNLNGEWDFAFDFSKSGAERKMYETGDYTHKINVPFCPESVLSGVHFTDFIPAVWYKRTVTVSAEDLTGEVLLHFGAVDYETTLWVNGKKAGTHIGGYCSFYFKIAKFLHEGENTIVVYAQDDTRAAHQPTGKQCEQLRSNGCMYTRTTGIWQTVWLEFVPKVYVKKIRILPHAEEGSVTVSVWLNQAVPGAAVNTRVSYKGEQMHNAHTKIDGDYTAYTMPLKEKYLWDVGVPHLYDMEIILYDSRCPIHESPYYDHVNSYFGLRSITLQDHTMYLNGRPLFQRLVLDQGFYPDGIYTAPDDDTLRRDIELSMALGFNGARLHEKVFEERFLYHADTMGYLVWGEYPNWGFDHTTIAHIAHFLPEWTRVVERDFNHPSLIGWCPFNETWDRGGNRQNNDLLALIYHATKAIDPTRPVIDTSGNYHVITDVYDVHNYQQDVEAFRKDYGSLKKGEAYDWAHNRQTYGGQPFFVSEYGGARWAAEDDQASWGYGTAPKTEEEFAQRYEGLTSALLGAEGICAFCYTQLYDLEQEKNGLYTYDRKRKFSDEVYDRIRATNLKKAAIETA